MMKKTIALATLALCFFCSLSAQEITKPKTKIYIAWVTLNDKWNPVKGVLYEIKDSSILISNSLIRQDYLTGNFKVSSISYDKIDLIKTRRTKHIQKGLLIGSVTGFALGAISFPAGTGTEGMGIVTGMTAFFGGFMYGILGAGIGTLLGSIKDRIPIKRDYANFNLYRGSLQDYSYVQEYPASTTRFEHKWFAGMTAGLSFPSANIGQTGFYGTYFLGYRFTRNIGISLSEYENDYPVKNNYGSASYWVLGGVLIRPLISFPVKDKFYFDIKPGLGYANAYQVVDEIKTKNGNGLGINFNTSLTYNFSKRWGFLAEAGYLFTRQKFEDNSTDKFQYFNLDFGFIYKFGKKSL